MAEVECEAPLLLLQHRLAQASRREERASRRARGGRGRHGEHGMGAATGAAPSRLADCEATRDGEATRRAEREPTLAHGRQSQSTEGTTALAGSRVTSPSTTATASATAFKTSTHANANTDGNNSNASCFGTADGAYAAGGAYAAERAYAAEGAYAADGDTRGVSTRSGRRGARREQGRQRQRQAPWPAVRFFQEWGVEEMVGEGRYGSVWRCVHRLTGAQVACKQVEKKGGPRWLARELECLSRAQGHPHVLTLSGVFESDKYLYIVTELCEGDLFEYIGSHKSPMPEGHARGLFRQLAQAVHHCHARGVLHRDLKPENILLKQCPETGAVAVKLADFGLSTRLEKGEKTVGWVGSDPYEAPEVLSSRPYDFSADVFSLGVVLFGMLSGTWPTFTHMRLFDAEENFSWPGWQGVSPEARRLITRMLSVDPRLRPSMADILDDLWFDVSFEGEERGWEEAKGSGRGKGRGEGERERVLGAVEELCAGVARRLRCTSVDTSQPLYTEEALEVGVSGSEEKEGEREREGQEKGEGVGEEGKKGEPTLDGRLLTAWRQLGSHAALSVPSHGSSCDVPSPSGLPLRCTTCVPRRANPPHCQGPSASGSGTSAARTNALQWDDPELDLGSSSTEVCHALAFWRKQHLGKAGALLCSPDGSGTERSWCSYGSALSSPSTASEYSPSPTLFADKPVPSRDTKF